MGLNWKLVAGKAFGTMADRENEYRKFATDYYNTEFKNRSEKMSVYNSEKKAQLKEIDRSIALLRAEGIDDKIIGNAINTYGENAFTVLAGNLDEFKKNQNVYGYLKKNDRLKDMFNKNFEQLLESGGTEMSYDIDLNRMKMTLLTDPPDFAELPDIPQSQFGFKYTGGIEESMGKLTEDAEVPEYDQRPAGVTGIGELFTMGLTDIPSEANFKNQGDLRRAIVDKLKAKYTGLVYSETARDFTPRFVSNAKENAFITEVNDKFNKIKTKYLNKRPDVAPGELRDIEEGAMTDQQLLDDIIVEEGLTVFSENPYAETDDTGDKIAVTEADFSTNMENELKNNANSGASKIYAIIKSNTAGLSVQQQQYIAQKIGAGVPLAKIIQDLQKQNVVLDPTIANQLNTVESSMTQSDRDVMSKHSGTSASASSSSSSTLSGQASGPVRQTAKTEKVSVGGRKQQKIINQPQMDAWDEIYGPHFNVDGTPKKQMTDPDLQALLKVLQAELKRKYPNVTL